MDKVYLIIALILVAIGWLLFKFIRSKLLNSTPIKPGQLWECPYCNDRNYAGFTSCCNCDAKRPREFRVFDAQGREQNMEKLWQQFEGMQNTDDVLVEKAKAIAPIVLVMAGNETTVLFKFLKENNYKNVDDKFPDVFLDIVIFYLHFIDRNAFLYLGAEQRSLFEEALFVVVREQLSRGNEDEIEADTFRSIFSEVYNVRQHEYGQCKKVFADEDEALGGTLFWEFGKKIAGLLGSEMDALVVMSTLTIVKSFAALQLPELFENNST